MNTVKEPDATPPPRGRLWLGGGVFIVGQLSPVSIPLVTSSSLSTGAKSALSGLLLLGVPELAIFAAIAILGKAGFSYLKQSLFNILKRAAPPDHVSRTRYRTGLVLFCLPLLIGWLAPYVGHLMPQLAEHRVALAIAGDGLLVVGLFVLGGDFWDKIRGLFVQEATITLP